MLRIIIIDDAPEKVRKYRELLQSHPEVNPKLIDTAASVEEAESKIAENQYDLALLDLYLPLRHGDDPDPENAIRLLNELSSDEELKMPYNIVGITRMKDADPKYKDIFDQLLLAYIVYEENSDDWKKKLCNKIDFLVKAQKSVQLSENYDYDVAIVNALESENIHVRRALCEEGWKEYRIPSDKSTLYFIKQFEVANGSKIRIVTCYALQMASTASAALTAKLIVNFRPRYLFMTGIAAGVKRDEVNLGDIMVATKVWDGASGKIKTDEGGNDIFYPDFHELPLNPDVDSMVRTLASKRSILNYIEEAYVNQDAKPPYRLQVRTGPIASVPAVLSSQEEVKKLITHCRKIIGIEMEGYGMFYAAHNSAHPRPEYVCLVKSVSDYADPDKSDNYQDYCMYTSASFVAHIIKHCLDF